MTVFNGVAVYVAMEASNATAEVNTFVIAVCIAVIILYGTPVDKSNILVSLRSSAKLINA